MMVPDITCMMNQAHRTPSVVQPIQKSANSDAVLLNWSGSDPDEDSDGMGVTGPELADSRAGALYRIAPQAAQKMEWASLVVPQGGQVHIPNGFYFGRGAIE